MAIHKSVKVDDIIFIHHLPNRHASSPQPIIVYRLKTRRGRTNGARVPNKFKKYFQSLNIKTIEHYYDTGYFTAVGVESFHAYRFRDSDKIQLVSDHILSIYKNKFTIEEMLIDTMKFEIPNASHSIKEMSSKIFIQSTDIEETTFLPEDEDGLRELDMFNRENEEQEDNPYEFNFVV
ncbi:hypothetical protein KLEB273_gp149 [Bacillus phage vB_BauM_KLEB27-3]|nr:hypothetical protein KLEB273_gp149 [Bacillus phage vB_BauM_KLEB27-3]